MNENKKPTEIEKVSCEVCLKEIPISEAKSEEANDYVLYFCGSNCYGKWREKSESEE